MASSKNSRNNRGKGVLKRVHNGNTVKPVLICGNQVGWGKYMGGEVDGTVVRDDFGRPLPLRQIGKMEVVG
jgi:hypothetical protein